MSETKTMTNSVEESTESDSSSSSEKIMSESDISRRDSTSSNSDLSDGPSGSPQVKRPRLATVIDPLFDDDYVEMFLSLMDFTPKPKVKYDGPPLIVTFAKLVLAHYKDTMGEDFELSRTRSMAPFPSRKQVLFPDGSQQESSDGGTHLNFFARPTGSDEPEYLFYGELSHWPINPQVVDCYMFPLGTDDGVDLILHPPYIFCPDCDGLGHGEESEDYDDFVEDDLDTCSI